MSINYQETSREAWESMIPLNAELDRAIMGALQAGPTICQDVETTIQRSCVYLVGFGLFFAVALYLIYYGRVLARRSITFGVIVTILGFPPTCVAAYCFQKGLSQPTEALTEFLRF